MAGDVKVPVEFTSPLKFVVPGGSVVVIADVVVVAVVVIVEVCGLTYVVVPTGTVGVVDGEATATTTV
jgi:hypothetical protein